MYCGDETGAFVGDCGLTSCRFGFGGEDCPKLVIPSHVKKSTSSSEAPEINQIFSYPKQSSTSTPHLPSEHDYAEQCTGLISSFSAWEATWEKAFAALHTQSDASKTPHPILAIDDSMLYNTNNFNSPLLKPDTARHQREQMMEIFFEKWDVPAAFFAPSPMVQAFSMGRQNALVVDLGGGGCRATPVIDGLICNMSQRRNGRGGEWLSEMQLEILKQITQISPIEDRNQLKYMTKLEEDMDTKEKELKFQTYNKSLFHRLSLLDLMYEMKTGDHMRVPQTLSVSWEKNDEASNHVEDLQSYPMNDSMDIGIGDEDKQKYELPDGTLIDLDSSKGGNMLCDLPELLFCTDPLHCTQLRPTPTTSPTNSIQSLIYSSISSLDVDARKELCGNILLCGSHSMFPSLDKRLSLEISELVSNNFKCRVIAPRNSMERRFASWIGGSVLTSLGSFQQLWLSKTEYEEYGATLACQRFP